MATPQTLTGTEAAGAIYDASRDKLRATVTAKHQDRWLTFGSDMVDSDDGSVWITYPLSQDGIANYEFSPGLSVGVAFRDGFRRFLFTAKIVSVEETGARALKLDMPEAIQVTERRTGLRVEMPALLTVEASLWLGGWQVRSDQPDAVIPVWSGRVQNLSEGGCYVRTNRHISRHLEVGDIVGLQLVIGEGDQAEEVLIDAQLCRSDPDGDMLMVGLQFMDAEQSEHVRRAHEKINARLCSY